MSKAGKVISDDSPTTAFDELLELVKKRHSCRRFRPDPIPDGHVEKLLEAARWAMSGGNSQPWELILVRNRKTIGALYKAYQEHINELNFWLEASISGRAAAPRLSDRG